MIKLFEINDAGIPEISDEARTIQVFKKLITRDKGSEGDHDGRKKYMATKEVAFVYWYSKFDSPYSQYEPIDRVLKIKKALSLPDEWKVDSDIKAAYEYFSEIQRTKSMKYLNSVEIAIDQISDYLSTTNINERNKHGDLVHDIDKYKKQAKELPDLLEALDKAKEVVLKELQEETATRAKRKINKYNK